ncbi:MAG TPA: hypothetical protein VNT02_16280, partial [Burkholderiales bacterium]|nr:hypothetical protein [Burkholderiales bacterium]
YLVRRTVPGYGHYEAEMMHAQLFDAKPALSAVWQARTAGQWLTVNENQRSTSPVLGVSLHTVPEARGYVISSLAQPADASASDTRAQMFLKMPMTASRDHNDIVIEPHGAEEWLRINSFVFRPLSSMPVLAAGTYAAALGPEGYGEWRRLPATGTVTVAGATSWLLFDGDFVKTEFRESNGTAPLPGRGSASYLLVYAAAGASVTITVA